MLESAQQQAPWALWAMVIVLGLSFGSFVTVLIHRLPRGESLLRPRSRCTSCGQQIKWYHNIPVISWIVLRGRCGFCGARVGWKYPLVEMLCLALFVVFYVRYGLSFTTPAFWYLSFTLLATFFIDLEHRIIPNALTYPSVVVGIAFAFLSPHIMWWQSILGAAVGLFGFLGVAYLGELLFKKESLGGGDIKLAAVLGAFLGAPKLILVLVLSAAIGLVISLVAMAVSPQIRKDRMIPFGPFLAIAALIAGLYGETIIRFYLDHFVG